MQASRPPIRPLASPRTRSLLSVFVPLLVAALSQQAYLLIAVAIAGNLGGTDVLAAVQSVSSVASLLPRVAVAASTGFAVLVGEAYGAGDMALARRHSSLAVRLSLVLGIVSMVVTWLLASSVTSLMDVPPEVSPAASSYLRMLALACPAMFAFNGVIAAMRTSGSPAVTTRISVIGLAATSLADMLLVGPMGMGAVGLGISQIGSYLLMLAMSVASLTRGTEWQLHGLKGTRRKATGDGMGDDVSDAVEGMMADLLASKTDNAEPSGSAASHERLSTVYETSNDMTMPRKAMGDTGSTTGTAGTPSATLLVPLGILLRSRSHLSDVGRMLLVGLPLAVQTACFTASAALVQAVVNAYGVVASAAFGVMSSIANVPWAVASSLGGVSTIAVSQAYGARDGEGMRESVSSLSRMAAWLLVLPCLVLCVLSYPIALAVSGNAEVAAVSSSMYWVAEGLYVVFAWNEIWLGAVKGTGDGMTPLVVNVVGVIAVRVLWVAVVAPVAGSVEAAVAVIPLSWLVVCVLAWGAWRRAREKAGMPMGISVGETEAKGGR